MHHQTRHARLRFFLRHSGAREARTWNLEIPGSMQRTTLCAIRRIAPE